jgi:opacity protein-like surface antigen
MKKGVERKSGKSFYINEKMKVMKKQISLVVMLCLLFVSTDLYGQKKKHKVEVCIGIWSTSDMLSTFSDIIISSLPTKIKMEDGNSFGSIHLDYRYNLTDRFALGGLMAFDYANAKGVFDGNETGKFYKRHYTLAVEAEYAYLRSGKFTMYALGGLGGTLYTLKYKDRKDSRLNDSATDPYAAFQVTPVGLRYGKNAGGFLEFGFGYRGIVNAGMFMKF